MTQIVLHTPYPPPGCLADGTRKADWASLTRPTALILSLLLLTWPGPPPAANDFEAVGLASGLAPVAASRIRLITERVVLTQTADDKDWRSDWQATATYVFHNPTAEPIATTFAFPEGCPEGEGDDSSEREGDDNIERDDAFPLFGYEGYQNPEFRGLVTLVRGQPVATRIMEAGSWPGLDRCIGRVHAFDISFSPNERVEVSHRYRFSASSGIGSVEVEYITRTGALWNGPIGSAEFILSPTKAAFGLSWPDGFRFAGFEERVVSKNEEGRIVYRFEARDWTPRQDFVVSLHGWPLAGTFARENGIALPCPDAATMANRDASPEHAGGGHLSGLSDADLGLCRNLPYARHGYPFQRTDLQQALYREVSVPGDEGAGPWRFRLAAPNGFYSDTLLDDTDRAYIAVLQGEQERRTGAADTNR